MNRQIRIIGVLHGSTLTVELLDGLFKPKRMERSVIQCYVKTNFKVNNPVSSKEVYDTSQGSPLA